jgi:hypothetical protein
MRYKNSCLLAFPGSIFEHLRAKKVNPVEQIQVFHILYPLHGTWLHSYYILEDPDPSCLIDYTSLHGPDSSF